MARRELNELILDPEDEHYRDQVFLSDTDTNTYAKFSDQSGYLHRRLTNCADSFVVDHMNGNSLDNRKINLRITSHAENCRNNDLSYKSPTGHQGIRYVPRLQKFVARITFNYKEYHIGVFCSLDEAVNARLKKEEQLWGIQPQREFAFHE